ncbi:putative reverse transcriptase domain-containing protein [Tanacetum coccineum]|uniref:Reverse transcriptase domain-containing protein n=1 Tax=Tanacetum coccineum TaxID=301880 RepID=A0ABQ4Y473_9ASTR
MHDPREPHLSALKRILRYVRGTLSYGLQLYSSTTSSLVAYSDADWAGYLTTRRSTSGYCVFLGNNLLSWSSKCQFTLSRSSVEAEYRGVANVVAETCWLHNLLRELHTPLATATLVYCDNVSVVYLFSNPVQHQRTKHIEIDIHFVRDLVATGAIRVLHVLSRYQYADIFTKGLPTSLFDEFRTSLSICSSPAPTAGGCKNGRPNITMEEYIRLEEVKAQRHDFKTEFPAIVFDNTLSSDTALPCEPTVSSTNKNKIDFRISLDESDDEDYTPSSSEPTADYLDDLDYFNDFKNEFPAIVYNDGLTSEPNLEIEPLDLAETMTCNALGYSTFRCNPDLGVLQIAVMSSASSAVTYTSVYIESEPGKPVALPSPNYIPGLEEPQTPPVPHDEDEREPMFIQPHDPDYVPKPIYPEYILLEDKHEFPAEEQPLPSVVSPTAESPGYVVKLDPKEDPEEYEDDETEDGLVDYPMDGGEDGDDDDGDSYGDDTDDEDEGDEEDEDEEEEEEHLALADSAVVVPTVELVSPPEGTKPVIPPPSAGECLARCMASSAHSSPPPVPSPLLPSSGCPTQIQTLRIASTQALVNVVTVALPSPPLPPLPPSLYIPPTVNSRDDILESERPPCKRSCLFALGSRYEVGESSTARPTGGQGIDYGDTWVDLAKAVPEIAPMTMGEVNTRVTELAELHEHDAQDLYALLEDAQDSRTHISQRVTMDSQRAEMVELLETDHRHQAQIVETLHVMRDMRREMGDMQAELLALRGELGSQHQMLEFQITKMLLEMRIVTSSRNEGIVGLTRWIEKMESVFNISGCAIENQFVANETEKVDKYISGLPDSIYGNVKSARPKTLDETIELANDLMGEKKPYDGSLPKSSGNTNVANTQKGNGANPKGNGCFECEAPGHFKRDCPKLNNKDGGNGSAQGWVYAVGNAEKKGNVSRDPESNVVTSTFLLNNRYASILFDIGADRSFISTTFSSLIDIALTLLENSYDVELADGKIVRVDTIMWGCTLNFLKHPFNIDLMLVELGSFDVIIGMDWLRRCHTMIVCDEKLVRIPYGNETLISHGNESNNDIESRLTIISCSKAQEYMAKGCQIFLAQISTKKDEYKSEGKQLKDVPIVRDFPKVFLEEVPGLSPAQPMEL